MLYFYLSALNSDDFNENFEKKENNKSVYFVLLY